MTRPRSDSVNSGREPFANGDMHPRNPRPAHLNAVAEHLARIHEEAPGEFYEASTGVPENTPITGTGEPGTPRTDFHPTVINLPNINQKLEQLPPPTSSKFSTPPASIIGDSSKWLKIIDLTIQWTGSGVFAAFRPISQSFPQLFYHVMCHFGFAWHVRLCEP
jgi:hypothetical protein